MDYFFYIIIFFKMIADHRQISQISWSSLKLPKRARGAELLR